jgi:hypothetical protein
LQQFDGVGVEIVGPRSSEPTRQIVDFVRNNRLPYSWHDTEQVPDAAIEGLGPERLPLVRLPGGQELNADGSCPKRGPAPLGDGAGRTKTGGHGC